MSVDTNKLNEFLGCFINDLGASVHAGMVVIGDRLGLYKALAQKPMTAAELEKKSTLMRDTSVNGPLRKPQVDTSPTNPQRNGSA